MDSELNLKRKRYKELRNTLKGQARQDWRLIEQNYCTANTLLTPDAWLLELESFLEKILQKNFYTHLDAWVQYREDKFRSSIYESNIFTQDSLFLESSRKFQLKRDFLYELDFNFWPLDRP